jgi:hypothetical protein
LFFLPVYLWVSGAKDRAWETFRAKALLLKLFQA